MKTIPIIILIILIIIMLIILISIIGQWWCWEEMKIKVPQQAQGRIGMLDTWNMERLSFSNISAPYSHLNHPCEQRLELSSINSSHYGNYVCMNMTHLCFISCWHGFIHCAVYDTFLGYKSYWLCESSSIVFVFMLWKHCGTKDVTTTRKNSSVWSTRCFYASHYLPSLFFACILAVRGQTQNFKSFASISQVSWRLQGLAA